MAVGGFWSEICATTPLSIGRIAHIEAIFTLPNEGWICGLGTME